ncbi:ATP-binding protein [Puniceicoccus vermicola]|uniref:ATP-binding protein n=1 Tax=Puniceicoccus vermicola TaxID=388746 RepID=A0A7X1E6G8_9BACT|nr:ATP-binding protein [Puniceicoccus vermicola]MBC2604234.1 ATP-binding protein [Puniceicoccus vermicola]
MQLTSVTISNFRGYHAPTKIAVDDMTMIVGRNDSGKSSIFDALDIFFGNSKLDADDRNKASGEDSEISIICTFKRLPVHVDLDGGHPTTLQKEHLLNSDGELEIKKVYKGKTPALKQIYAVAEHPEHESVRELLALKRTQLRQLAGDLGVDLTDVNEAINSELRAAIRSSVQPLTTRRTEVPLDKEDAKAIWQKVEPLFPVFALFRSDRDSKDGDDEAQDPLKAAVELAIKDKTSELDTVFDYVQSEVQKIADATLKKLREMDPTLANELKPRFDKPAWHKLFKASITGDSEIPINKRGSGVRRLILLNFFRAKAARLIEERKAPSAIYAVEEPETSQHPHNQRILLRALEELLQAEQCQVMLTTHTPILARVVELPKIRYVKADLAGGRMVEGVNEQNWQVLASDLGVLPETMVKLFVCVEGKHDIPFLLNLCDALRADGMALPDLRRLEIDGYLIFAPLGGANLVLWSNRLGNLLKPEFHLYDRDNQPPADPKYKDAIDAITARAAAGEPVFATATGKREMENYVHIDAINAALTAQGFLTARTTNYADFDDVPNLMRSELNAISPPHAQWNEGGVKAFIANAAVKEMNQARLSAIDPDGHVAAWFTKIEELMQ